MSNPDNVKITIFTPTYNRENFLGKLYETLVQQTNKNFEWLIVDDGSTDSTAQVVAGFIKEGLILIRYYNQANAGKHIAINTGVNYANGELFYIVDSDDWLPSKSIEIILYNWEQLKSSEKIDNFAGVSGNRQHPDGKDNGGSVKYNILDSDVFEYRHVHHISGDKAEVYRTDLLRKFPFPKYEGEKFCPESVVWYRIGEFYKLRFFNQATYIGDYLSGGLTDRSVQIRAESPRYTALAYKEMINSAKMPLNGKIKSLINYWRFSPYNSFQTFSEKLGDLSPWWSIALFPIGYLMYLKEKKSTKVK